MEFLYSKKLDNEFKSNSETIGYVQSFISGRAFNAYIEDGNHLISTLYRGTFGRDYNDFVLIPEGDYSNDYTCRINAGEYSSTELGFHYWYSEKYNKECQRKADENEYYYHGYVSGRRFNNFTRFGNYPVTKYKDFYLVQIGIDSNVIKEIGKFVSKE